MYPGAPDGLADAVSQLPAEDTLRKETIGVAGVVKIMTASDWQIKARKVAQYCQTILDDRER